VEIVVTPNLNIVKRGVLIGSAAKLGRKLGGILVRRNLSQSLMLQVMTTKVVGTLQMVFTNMIMVIHGNKIANRPLMSSMAIGGCRSVDVVYSRGGYQESVVVTTPNSWSQRWPLC
jgi:hypothetical protein